MLFHFRCLPIIMHWIEQLTLIQTYTRPEPCVGTHTHELKTLWPESDSELY
jgi:hypothetical protein